MTSECITIRQIRQMQYFHILHINDMEFYLIKTTFIIAKLNKINKELDTIQGTKDCPLLLGLLPLE